MDRLCRVLLRAAVPSQLPFCEQPPKLLIHSVLQYFVERDKALPAQIVCAFEAVHAPMHLDSALVLAIGAARPPLPLCSCSGCRRWTPPLGVCLFSEFEQLNMLDLCVTLDALQGEDPWVAALCHLGAAVGTEAHACRQQPSARQGPWA